VTAARAAMDWKDGDMQRIAIGGGGFAGATVARSLARRLPEGWEGSRHRTGAGIALSGTDREH